MKFGNFWVAATLLYGFCHLASAGDNVSNAEQSSQQYPSAYSVSVVVVNSEELVYDALN